MDMTIGAQNFAVVQDHVELSNFIEEQYTVVCDRSRTLACFVSEGAWLGLGEADHRIVSYWKMEKFDKQIEILRKS